MEDPKILRTTANYNTHVADRSHGIQEECCFNAIPSFNVIENFCFDPMHDVFEGVCRYDLAKILHFLIFKDKLFSISTLNNRLKYFQFDLEITRNIPPAIFTKELLKKECLILRHPK